MFFNKSFHEKYLYELPKLSQNSSKIKILFTPNNFKKTLLEKIYSAKYRICIVSLYLEHDDAGKNIMSALYSAKRLSPNLDISIFVDLHRATRNRIGEKKENTNANWYHEITKKNLKFSIPIYGVAVNIKETLGVLHLKGFIIDDFLLYTGANINNVYLNQYKKYRYDRYYLIKNKKLTDIMFSYIQKYIKIGTGTERLDLIKKNKTNKYYIHKFRYSLRNLSYEFNGTAHNKELSVIPLIGLGKNSSLNKTIFHLIGSTKKKLILCTPYFNLPSLLLKKIVSLLHEGIKIEIIISDKIANDFYIPKEKPFKIIGILPYLYEMNLKKFMKKLNLFINKKQLLIKLWKNKKNSFHLKGIWVDDHWILVTGNNFTQRGWRLDLENAILIHDPFYELGNFYNKELNLIRKNTTIVNSISDLEDISNYPKLIKKIIFYLRRIYIDRILNRIL